MTKHEKFLEDEFSFGKVISFDNENIKQRCTQLYVQQLAFQPSQKQVCIDTLGKELAFAEQLAPELTILELFELKIQILKKYTQNAFDEYCDAYKEQFSQLPLSIEDYQRLQNFFLKNNKSS